jgi:TRAP-type uncharacterized transport system substrate-binding protein
MSHLALRKSTAALAVFTIMALQSAAAQQRIAVNRGVVELETSSTAGISVRIAEDLANLVDDGAARRVVPVVGKGSLQNLFDLKYLHGVDMAILSTDVLDYAKEQKLLPGLDSSLSYITRLYNEEFHLLAGPNVKSVDDLANRRVNVDLRGSGTAITAGRVFELLKLPVIVTNDSQEVALDNLRRGEIAALAFVAGKPAPFFAQLTDSDGLHFLAVPFNEAVGNAYAPARLTAVDYPKLIVQNGSVDTLAVGNVLAVAELRQLPERDRNVANFVEVFFTGFQSLLAPGHHPKWQEVNLSADFPGWRRYGPAEQWLNRNMQIAKAPGPEQLKAMFSHFVDERRQAMGGAPMSQQDKDDLFRQFQSWEHGR